MNKTFDFDRFKIKSLYLLTRMLVFSKKTSIYYIDWLYPDYEVERPKNPCDCIVLPSTRVYLESIRSKKIFKGITRKLYYQATQAYLKAAKYTYDTSLYRISANEDIILDLEYEKNMHKKYIIEKDDKGWKYGKDGKVLVFKLTTMFDLKVLKDKFYFPVKKFGKDENGNYYRTYETKIARYKAKVKRLTGYKKIYV